MLTKASSFSSYIFVKLLSIPKALVATQDRLQKDVDGFQFNLGYSGGFYLSGNDDEDEGDKKLLGKLNVLLCI